MAKIKKIFNKHHQLYLLILSFSLIFLVTFYSLTFPKKESVISSISPTPTSHPTNKPMPTTAKVSPHPLKSIDGSYLIGTRNLEVKYDSKAKTTSLFFKENGQNILINSFKSAELSDGNIYRNIPIKFSISSDNNYLTYLIASEFEGSISEFYNFPDKKITPLKISIDDSGFSKNNQYFYACSSDGMIDGGVFVYQLPKMQLMYQELKGNMKCKYDERNNSLKINYTEYENKPFAPNAVYYFDNNKLEKQ